MTALLIITVVGVTTVLVAILADPRLPDNELRDIRRREQEARDLRRNHRH